MPKLLFMAFISCSIFYSSGVFAETEQQTTEPDTENLMSILDQVFQPNRETVKEHDELVNSTVSDMKRCLYKGTLKDSLLSVFVPSCSSVAEQMNTELLSYFILSDRVNRNQNMEKERKTFLQDLLADTFNRDEEMILKQKDVIEYLSTQLGSCHDEASDETDESMDSFNCKALIEEVVAHDLISYFVIRDVIQNLNPKSQSVDPIATEEPQKISKP